MGARRDPPRLVGADGGPSPGADPNPGHAVACGSSGRVRIHRGRARRNAHRHRPRNRRIVASDFALDEPDREHAGDHPARHPQREALARRVDGAALGRNGPDGSGEEVPSGEGLPGHAATARGTGRHRRRRGSRQESQRGVKREPGSPSTFNGERDIPMTVCPIRLTHAPTSTGMGMAIRGSLLSPAAWTIVPISTTRCRRTLTGTELATRVTRASTVMVTDLGIPVLYRTCVPRTTVPPSRILVKPMPTAMESATHVTVALTRTRMGTATRASR